MPSGEGLGNDPEKALGQSLNATAVNPHPALRADLSLRER
jgi:hypothetical protein